MSLDERYPLNVDEVLFNASRDGATDIVRRILLYGINGNFAYNLQDALNVASNREIIELLLHAMAQRDARYDEYNEDDEDEDDETYKLLRDGYHRRHINEGDRCSICLDDIEHDGYITGCGHKFHGSCLQEWLNSGEQSPQLKCPQCRKTLRIY